MPSTRRVRFMQVDVFTSSPFKGNPLAVVFDADDLDTEQMQAIARWTNLSETAFLLRPTDPEADYRVRIFTTTYEMPFAGHPTLGSAHALLASGYRPKHEGRLLQQCNIGLVRLAEQAPGHWAFAAPSATFTPLDAAHHAALAQAWHTDALDLSAPPCLVNNGPAWLVTRIQSADACLALHPDLARLERFARDTGIHKFAFYGPHPAHGPTTFEVRCMITGGDIGLEEDPVTGSANAGIASLLHQHNQHPGNTYTVRQGTALKRDGRLSVRYDETGTPWIGGTTETMIEGSIHLA
ncbi:PhzF family phenazine biosynthesis protein [Dyella sp. OK004]|uniref:PhzF family phenazine biosynthesis protein n=1 Tax=Dyella sp. OK004 TaxID=1855292 RepID=UPI000B89BB24|nr:PhzF family phenazine biosynthesis protein [Dyella sp. OK004]